MTNRAHNSKLIWWQLECICLVTQEARLGSTWICYSPLLRRSLPLIPETTSNLTAINSFAAEFLSPVTRFLQNQPSPSPQMIFRWTLEGGGTLCSLLHLCSHLWSCTCVNKRESQVYRWFAQAALFPCSFFSCKCRWCIVNEYRNQESS